MKIKNIIKLFIVVCTTNNLLCSYFQPSTRISEPVLARAHNALFDTTVSYSFADQAYNQQHQKVPLLQQYGAENFLQRFINKDLASTDTSSWGDILFTGKSKNLQLDLCTVYTIKNNFFVALSLTAIDFKLSNINASYTHENPTNDQQIALQTLLRTNIDPATNYGLFAPSFHAGYTACFQNFTNLNFVDISVYSTCTTPQALHEPTHGILHVPHLHNSHPSIRLTATTACGMLDWLVCGAYVSPTFCFNQDHHASYNPVVSNNRLLHDDKLPVTVHPKPTLTCGLYAKAEHIFPGFTCLLGYIYTHNYGIQLSNIPAYANQDAAQAITKSTDYTVGTLYTAIEFDFAQEKDPHIPKFSLRCNIPIHGKFALRSKSFSANYCLQFNKEF